MDAKRGKSPPKGGPNPLFWGLVVVTLLAIAAALGVRARDTAPSMHSFLVYRIEVGLAVWLVGYLVAAGWWLGWHRRLFKRFPIPGLGEAETAPVDAQGTVDDLAQRVAEMGEFRSTTLEALAEVRERLARAEGRLSGQEPQQRLPSGERGQNPVDLSLIERETPPPHERPKS